MMNKRKIRDIFKLIIAALLWWLYIPHMIFFCTIGNLNKMTKADLCRPERHIGINLPSLLQFLYNIHNDRYFRNLFYHRLGPVASLLIGWWRPGDRYFVISATTKIGEGAYCAHPFSTEINAECIGANFTCRNNTTIGNKFDGDNNHRAVIGDNVTLGVNVSIIGPVNIGNNVTIGAGSVVVKDIPDNCVAVGNPCKPIKYIELS